MTWNIWGGKHLDRVVDLIKQENPDVIGLQEVKVIDGENHAEIIAEKLGYHNIYCQSFTTDRHTPPYTLGNAILSKQPILNPHCHFLSSIDQYEGSAKTEPRTLVEAEIPFEDNLLTFFTTHMAYSDNFTESEMRDYQLEKLLKVIENKTCILMGDFNSLPNSRTVNQIEKQLVNTDREKTEISYIDQKLPDHPEYRIDYIFADKKIRTANFRIIETQASDHRPLVVELEG